MGGGTGVGVGWGEGGSEGWGGGGVGMGWAVRLGWVGSGVPSAKYNPECITKGGTGFGLGHDSAFGIPLLSHDCVF